MSKTSLLPPMTAVQMTWALTGLFSKEKPTQNSIPSVDKTQDGKKNSAEEDEKGDANADRNHPEGISSRFPIFLVNKALEDMRNRAKNDRENKYVDRVIAAMNASLRSIHTIYKGRNLNFDENEELRVAYLKSMKESIGYWYKLKNILKSLPTTSLGAAGGVTLTKILFDGSDAKFGSNIGSKTNFDPIFSAIVDNIAFQKFLLIAGFAALGFLVGWVLIWWGGRKTWKLYVKRDYERNLYFRRYLEQVTIILESLYEDVCQIYEETFGKSCPKEDEGEDIIKDMLKGMQPKLCTCVDKHMQENKITVELWPMCETGNIDIIEKHCKVWKKERRKSRFFSFYEKVKNIFWNFLYVLQEDDKICNGEDYF